jgi:hypothetical protein
MKVHVYCDSMYPVYGIIGSKNYSLTVEISEELFAEINAAEAAYEAIQQKLKVLEQQQNGPLG